VHGRDRGGEVSRGAGKISGLRHWVIGPLSHLRWIASAVPFNESIAPWPSFNSSSWKFDGPPCLHWDAVARGGLVAPLPQYVEGFRIGSAPSAVDDGELMQPAVNPDHKAYLEVASSCLGQRRQGRRQRLGRKHCGAATMRFEWRRPVLVRDYPRLSVRTESFRRYRGGTHARQQYDDNDTPASSGAHDGRRPKQMDVPYRAFRLPRASSISAVNAVFSSFWDGTTMQEFAHSRDGVKS